MSTWTCPAAAVTSEIVASALARVSAPLELAVNSAGCCDPATVAASVVVARTDALGRSAPANECRTNAGALGAKAAPSGAFCVAFARRAEPDATRDGLSAASNARSKFAACPTPETPFNDRVIAVRDASGVGADSPGFDCAVAGLSTLEGDAATCEIVALRAGLVELAACELIVGTLDAAARDDATTWLAAES